MTELTNTQARSTVDKDGALEQEAAWCSHLAAHTRKEYPRTRAYFEAKARGYALAAMWGRLAVL